MTTLVDRHPTAARTGATRVPRPFWNPYVAGFFLGLVLLGTYAITGRGLGATAGFAGFATWLTSLLAPAEMQSNVVHAKYWNDGAPLANWTLFLLIGAVAGAALSGWQGRRFNWSVERGPRVTDGQRLALAFVGGFIAAWGAKIAKGCTSGQALTGGSLLNVGSLVFMLAVFAAAYGLAWFVRKEWL
jgi:uncharacterized membrane protein YedE/YeeE